MYVLVCRRNADVVIKRSCPYLVLNHARPELRLHDGYLSSLMILEVRFTMMLSRCPDQQTVELGGARTNIAISRQLNVIREIMN